MIFYRLLLAQERLCRVQTTLSAMRFDKKIDITLIVGLRT
jgi:hypothetical protein